MPDGPLVSVVMPAYNAERFVASAVQSILGQTFRGFEFIIIDDGSTDATGPILDEFAAKDTRIRMVRQPNRGLIASLNVGCSMAQGTYIARMDADDISLPERLQKQVELLQTRPEVGIAGTWIQDIDPDGRRGPYWPVPTDPSVIRWVFMFGNCLAHPTVMMRRDVVGKIGFYRPEAVVEDYDLWVRASSTTDIVNIPRVLLLYRVYASSVSVKESDIRNEKAIKVRTDAIAQATRLSVSESIVRRLESVVEGHSILPGDIDDAEKFLRNLYDAYVQKNPLRRAERSEIALDLIRRQWSVAAAARKAALLKSFAMSARSLSVIPEVVSVHGVQTAARLFLWFLKESPRTQNDILSWKRLRI